uniref:HotDog ACOT-type domain-containing protein n=1 Tax=Helicotheca tamesis TaxID=374047 RepID=A0A7S2N4T5_9STRA
MATQSCLRKLMAPSTANHMGNVHGGNILRLCEEAGRIVATKYSLGQVALVGASQTQFHSPIHVGEVASVSATLDYVSRHAMRVSLKVEAEHLESGRTRETNSSNMWYSIIDVKPRADGMTGVEMIRGERPIHPLHPSLVAPDAASELKKNAASAARLPLSTRSPKEFPVTLQVTPDVDSISNHPFVSAGYVLKLMDEAGAVVAAAHTKHQCVTVLLDKVCFRTPIRLGDLCTVRAGVTYTSSRSVETVVQVWKTELPGGAEKEGCGSICAVEARFVFVALGDNGKVVEVPELPPDQRTIRWNAGAAKHEERVAEKARAKL